MVVPNCGVPSVILPIHSASGRRKIAPEIIPLGRRLSQYVAECREYNITAHLPPGLTTR